MMTWRHTQEWLKDCATLVQYQATEKNPNGLAAAANWYTARFEKLGFSVKTIENKDAPYRPLLVALRPQKTVVKHMLVSSIITMLSLFREFGILIPY